MPTYDVGRTRHALDLMHYSKASNGSSIPSNWIPAATGDSGVGWQPQSSGSVSYGSNSSAVAEISIVGVATTVARSDHYHAGVNNITSSSSNTLQRGTVNLRSGTNIGLTATDTDGDGEFDTVTIHASAVSGGGGSSSGITHTYLGYNTIGGTYETTGALKVYAKKITVSTAGILTAISAYVQATTSDQVGGGMVCAVYDDASGTPDNVIMHTAAVNDILLMDDTSGAGGVSKPRWLHCPVGMYLAAGDYWIACLFPDQSDGIQLAYDTSGSDRTYTAGGNWFADWGFYTPTTTSNKYSIRASIIS